MVFADLHQHFVATFDEIEANLTPKKFRFERQTVNVKYSTRDQRLFQVEEIDGSTIMKLTAEIRDTMDKIDDLTSQARGLGF